MVTWRIETLERSDETTLSVAMTFRVPARNFQQMLGKLRRYGTVLSETMTGQDVTEEYRDTEAELSAKRRMEERLLAIVDGSKSVKDMLEVERELARVRGEINRLEGHGKYLANRVAFATIHVSFVSPAQPLPNAPESVVSKFGNALRQAGSYAVVVATSVIVVLGAAAPILLPVLAVFWVRRRRLVRTPVATEV